MKALEELRVRKTGTLEGRTLTVYSYTEKEPSRLFITHTNQRSGKEKGAQGDRHSTYCLQKLGYHG
jgi:hypothetical protein